ncbi:hypothetical protein BH10BAC1_BH10BAC1_13180 [soil metagenome]
MKTLFLILTLFLFANFVRGTECVDRTFLYDHIDFHLCQNYSNYNETTSLLYKARANQLNKFIANLVGKGVLKNKKFTIEIYDPELTYNYINISQSNNSYNIDCSGFLSFEEIAKMIFYFTQADWGSFTYDPSKVKDQSQTRQKLLNIINKYSLPDISSYVSDSAPLWQLDDLSLIYNNDSIHYYSNGKILPYKPTSNLPIKIRDRYLFFQDDRIFVHKDSTILTFKISEVEEQDYVINGYEKWVDIGLGAEHVLYSYSYDKNKFYDLIKKKKER